MKRCTKCGEEKPQDEFHRHKKERDGLCSQCKVCAREKGRLYRKAHPGEAREYARLRYEANPERGRESARLYREAHPEKVKKSQRRWWEAHREEERERSRLYYEANPEKRQEASRRWREANPEKVREMDRLYCEANPEKVREKKQRRRVRKRGNGIEPVSLEAVWERDGGICHICGKRIDPKLEYPDPMSKSLDHLQPISDGGPHAEWNVAYTHLRCNARRGAGRIPAQIHLALSLTDIAP